MKTWQTERCSTTCTAYLNLLLTPRRTSDTNRCMPCCKTRTSKMSTWCALSFKYRLWNCSPYSNQVRKIEHCQRRTWGRRKKEMPTPNVNLSGRTRASSSCFKQFNLRPSTWTGLIISMRRLLKTSRSFSGATQAAYPGALTERRMP